MTEAEWLSAREPSPLLADLYQRNLISSAAGRRKFQLFACGCCRLVWPLLADARSRKAVAKLERYADRIRGVYRGSADPEIDRLRRDAYNIANAAYIDLQRANDPTRAAACVVVCAAYPAVPDNIYGNLRTALAPTGWAGDTAVRRLEADLVRDIFGNPFRPVAVEPGWRTEAVVALARAIYDERAWDRLPVLADALDDAGCTNAALLGHLRDPALTHVRGCWAVDLILGLS